MILPGALLLLILLPIAIAALPWYRVPTPATRAAVLNRIVRLGITLAALRIGAFVIVFNLKATGWVQLLGYFLVIFLYPEIGLFTPTRSLSQEQKMVMMLALAAGSFILSALCVLVLASLNRNRHGAARR